MAQAIAARGGAASPAPAPAPTPAPEPAPAFAPAPSSAQNTPPVGPRRTHGAAIAATMVSLPAARVPGLDAPIPGASPNQSGQITPPPVSVTPPPQSMAPAPSAGPPPTPKPAAGGNFRETLWFKKGDVDQMVEDARKRVEAARAKGQAVPDAESVVAAAAAGVDPEGAPIDDQRYVDDGSLTVEDRKKFSLRSGATSTALPTVAGAMPGERMSDAEVMGEIGGKKKFWIIAIALVVVALLGVFAYRKLTVKDVSKSAAAMTPPTIPTTELPPPAPPAPTPPVAAVKPPAAAAKDGDEPTPKASHPPAAKKHVVAKKAKGKKAHK